MSDFDGTPGPDILVGTVGPDSFLLQAGGDDRASGGEGNDGFYFGKAYTGADIVDGGAGIDTLALQGDYLSLALGAINAVEVIALLPGSDSRFGDTAGDSYSYAVTTSDAGLAAGAILTIIAGELRADETLTFSGGAEVDGHFRVFAGRGADSLTGGRGNDGFFFGADGNLTGTDRIDGGAGTDSIALRGNYTGQRAVAFQDASLTAIEVITLLSGHSNEFGGLISAAGFDYDLTMAEGNVAAGRRVDVIAGNLHGNESVRFDGRAETNGSYRVLSGAGDDTLYGGAGNDVLYGGLGADRLEGGAGVDRFGFASALGGSNIDLLVDFNSTFDAIELAGGIGQAFAALATGWLNSGVFAYGAVATDADDRILYDSATGALRYDADGVGGAAAIQFAAMPTGLWLTGQHFIVTGAANAAPQILSGATATVAENASLSTIIYQAQASDTDGDAFVYSLGFGDEEWFTIDQTGAVRLRYPADFETRASYEFTVVAADSADARGSQRVTLNVINDSTDPVVSPIVWERENNDSSSFPQRISSSELRIAPNPLLENKDLPSATINGTISVPTDQDWFSIELKEGQLLILDVDISGGNLDTLVRLYWSGRTIELTGSDDRIGLDPGSDPHPDYGHNTDSFVRMRAPWSGTYYFSIESFQDAERPTSGSYELQVSVGPAVSKEVLFAEDVEALLSGSQWPTIDLTYSFPTSPSHYPAEASEDLQGFAPFTPAQQAATTALLQQIAGVSLLSFEQVTAGPADLRFAMNGTSEAAYAYYPGSELGGTAWFNTQDFNDPRPATYGWMGILHETGHALGLKHGHEPPPISYYHDSLEYSVMTYRAYAGDPLTSGGYGNETSGFPQTLMMLDIAALQKMYGANFGTNAGDTVYSWSETTGEMSLNGVGQGAPWGNRVFMTVWDGGGEDTYDLSNYHNFTLIDLRPGEWVKTAQSQIANLGNGSYARGNVANALLFEGDPRSLIENAIGGHGNDLIIANQAVNRLTGNGSNDTFQWTSTADSIVGAADTVTDFDNIYDDTPTDKLHLGDIDANALTAADDSFTFIGTDAFTNAAGQLRYEVIGGSAHLFADVNGDGLGDMEIILTNVTSLHPTDFIVL